MVADKVSCPLNPDASRELGRLEGKVDSLIQSVADAREERLHLDTKLFGDNGVLVRYSERLGDLERWQARSGGAIKALGILWGVVALTVGWLISLWSWGK